MVCLQFALCSFVKSDYMFLTFAASAPYGTDQGYLERRKYRRPHSSLCDIYLKALWKNAGLLRLPR